MSSKEFKVGSLLENSQHQFTKIIAVKNGIYALSGWTARKAAEKATVAHMHVNKHGLEYANARVASTSKAKANAPAEAGEGESKGSTTDDSKKTAETKTDEPKVPVTTSPKTPAAKPRARRAKKTAAKK